MNKKIILDVTSLLYRGDETIVPDFNIEEYIIKYIRQPDMGMVIDQLIDFLESKGFKINYEYFFRFITDSEFYITTHISSIRNLPQEYKVVKFFKKDGRKFIELDITYETLGKVTKMEDLLINKYVDLKLTDLIDKPKHFYIRSINDLINLYKEDITDMKLLRLVIKIALEIGVIFEFKEDNIIHKTVYDSIYEILNKEYSKDYDKEKIINIINTIISKNIKDIKEYIKHEYNKDLIYIPYGWNGDKFIVAIGKGVT